MRRGGRILILLGLLLGVVAAVGVVGVLILNQPVSVVQRTPIVIAAQPINQFAEITADQLTVTQWPVVQDFPIPAQAFSNPQDVVGKLALSSIPQGSAIVQSQVISKTDAVNTRRNLSYILDKGSIALALPVSSESSIANGLQPGDHVDLIASFSSSAPAPTTGTSGQTTRVVTTTVTQRMLQNVLVLGVSSWTGPSPQGQQQPVTANIVTLQISEQDALVFRFTETQADNWTFVLRPVNDDQSYNPTPMTLDYINKKFGFQLTSP